MRIPTDIEEVGERLRNHEKSYNIDNIWRYIFGFVLKDIQEQLNCE